MDLITDTNSPADLIQGYSVYIMSDKARKLFYIGVTGFLMRKIAQHLNGKGYEDDHASGHSCRDLVYVEQFSDANLALDRERKIRNLSHMKIEALINAQNPESLSLNDKIARLSSALL